MSKITGEDSRFIEQSREFIELLMKSGLCRGCEDIRKKTEEIILTISDFILRKLK